MKDLFPGYFKPDSKEIKKIWKSCLFVFDTNILLNLYRYSNETQKEFLELLKKINDRIWIPNRVGEEYLANRIGVIHEQENTYDKTIKSIEDLKDTLNHSRRHPFITKNTLSQVEQTLEALTNELQNNKANHIERFANDDIQQSIVELFNKRVGKEYSKKELHNIFTEGEQRYSEKIPPGYKDKTKGSDNSFINQCRVFGDLIIWKQIIDKSIDVKKDIILVIDDKKEDWWFESKGKTIGPRPELIKEFKSKTNHNIHMYQADRFLELAQESLHEKVSEKAVEEIKEVRDYQVELANIYNQNIVENVNRIKSLWMDQDRLSYLNSKEMDLHLSLQMQYAERTTLITRLKDIEKKLETIKNRNVIKNNEIEKASILDDIADYNLRIKHIKLELKNIAKEQAQLEKNLDGNVDE